MDLTQGIPAYDTFGRVWAVLEPITLQQAFMTWMSALANLAEKGMALDGKPIRRSLDRVDGTGAIHVVSAWASLHALVLAQCKVADTSHEITAVPARLALLNLHGSEVAIDAMGCQVEIARQMVDYGGESVLSLKAKQPSWHRECDELSEWRRGPHPMDQEVVLGYDAQVDGGHGRLETRKA